MALTAYIPQDRLRALSRGEKLPDRTAGSAMLADISGFTPLTEGLRQSLGPRQGAEEVTRYLNTVFSALIAEVERYGGSVISFAGDAITCWFDQSDEDSPTRAAAAAFAMQAAMAAFTTMSMEDGTTRALTLKIAISSGPARRFVVGDPAIHYLDALAGSTIDRTAEGEHLAKQGEILLDKATQDALGDLLVVREWRGDSEGERLFAVAEEITASVAPLELSDLGDRLSDDLLGFWLPEPLRKHAISDFTADFRPCAVMFVHFEGIDYDREEASEKLNVFITSLQATAEKYEGTCLQLTIGDKGSYAYINFGALKVHEDDARRAVRAALAIQSASHLPLQIGIAQGVMRVGAYGGETRKTYGALGDDVNLAARLMTTAGEDQIFVSGRIHKATHADFNFQPQAPLPMKGKAEPLPVFSVTGERSQRAIRLQEPRYALPMVGRKEELALIEARLDLASKGQGQVIGIVAEAGLGKSRLAAEVIRSARAIGFVGYGGACQSDGIHTPYLVWKSIWKAFFDVDPEKPDKRLTRWLEAEIGDRAPGRTQAMPLLNAVLDLQLPENDFTRLLEPEDRQGALHALLEDCLKAASKEESTLIVIEDLHWIDALSYDLLEQLVNALAAHPVCFVLAYRPPHLERLKAPRLEALPQFTKVELHELTRVEAESAIRAKLAQLYPARGASLPEGLLDALMARAQGNPFYLEELLNYLRDRSIDPSEIDRVELPDSLHALILSRIDQLSKLEKATLRSASIIGRLFRARWLTGYYPELGAFPEVKATLDALDALEITPLESYEPELVYLFKHIATHEVAYENLSYGTRARLHEMLARYLEEIGGDLDTIAFHYRHSTNSEKQREYLRKAGEFAQGNFANAAALEYYGMLLPLLEDEEEQTQILMNRGQVLELMGEYDQAENDFRTVQEKAKGDQTLLAAAQFGIGKLFRFKADYDQALAGLAEAYETWSTIGDSKGLAEVLVEKGFVHIRRGEFDDALQSLSEGQDLAREIEDRRGLANASNHLGIVAMMQGDYPKGRKLFEESLALRRESGDKRGVARSLINLGLSASEQGDLAVARRSYQECIGLTREIGDKWANSAALTNLGLLEIQTGQLTEAGAVLEESLALMRELGDKYGIATSLNSIGNIAREERDPARARMLFEESLDLRREANDRRGIHESLNNLGLVAFQEGHHSGAQELLEQSLEIADSLGDKSGRAAVLFNMGLVALARASEPDSTWIDQARQWIQESLTLRREIQDKIGILACVVGMSRVAFEKGDISLAVQLAGAAEALYASIQARMDIDVRIMFNLTTKGARELLDEKTFNTAWGEGADLGLEDAAALALDIAVE